MSSPHPKNASGSFYVENDHCIACDAPFHEAPDLMGTDDGNGGYHCHFRRQPDTPEEVDRAIMACVVSCVRAVRYAGNDPVILQKFQELKSADSCDTLPQEPLPEKSPSEVLQAAKNLLRKLGGAANETEK